MSGLVSSTPASNAVMCCDIKDKLLRITKLNSLQSSLLRTGQEICQVSAALRQWLPSSRHREKVVTLQRVRSPQLRYHVKKIVMIMDRTDVCVVFTVNKTWKCGGNKQSQRSEESENKRDAQALRYDSWTHIEVHQRVMARFTDSGNVCHGARKR